MVRRVDLQRAGDIEREQMDEAHNAIEVDLVLGIPLVIAFRLW